MKLSVIVATRNRVGGIRACLDSVVASLVRAEGLTAELIVVDNGSTDGTAAALSAWAATAPIDVQCLSEPLPGQARAQNRALRAASGTVIAFTDDDCCWSPDYARDLLRHCRAGPEMVLRGGRIDLGDGADLPLTINTDAMPGSWSRADRSIRRTNFAGRINGCNLVVPRAVFDRLGLFDERFGTGSPMRAGSDTEFLYRAYVAGFVLVYVPDMAVRHFHGRRTAAAGRMLMEDYMIASGALWTRYALRHPDLCWPFVWDCRNAALELLGGSNTFMPGIGFSHRDKVAFSLRGAMRYLQSGRTARAPAPNPAWRGAADAVR